MSKQISFKIGKDEYVLEYDRDIVQRMEASGFVLDDLSDKPFTMIPIMVRAAFVKHHSRLSEQDVEKIIDKIGGYRESLVKGLTAMLMEQVSTLVTSDEDAEGTENPIKLTANFDI